MFFVKFSPEYNLWDLLIIGCERFQKLDRKKKMGIAQLFFADHVMFNSNHGNKLTLKLINSLLYHFR